jgi:endonuclease-3
MKNDALRKKALTVQRRLNKFYPDATIELNFSNPVELLIATILSAQCTDVRVNEVTKTLFREFKRPQDYYTRPAADLEAIIRPTGFFRQKAKSIRGAMEKIIALHKGKVPNTMEELTALPGVGRKTANVVLGNAYDLPGLPVDTHVTRVSNRLGLTKNKDAVKIEADLHTLLPPGEWCQFSHNLIFHGRRTCKARSPLCEKCPLTDLCIFFQEQHS